MRLPGGLVPVCVLVVMFGGCGSKPTKERFYTLNPIASTTTRDAIKEKLDYSVSVGPVKVPEMLDRPQFVIREGENRVRVIEQHRWAGSLQTEIARVLAADLNAQLDGAQVTAHNGYAGQNATYRIFVDVERFDAILDDAVTVQMAWTIRPANGDTAITGRSSVREPSSSGGYDGLAASYGRALATISAEIGNAVRTLQMKAVSQEKGTAKQ